MDSTELYRQLLGVTTPWTVERVEMSVPDVRVDVHLSHPPGARFAINIFFYTVGFMLFVLGTVIVFTFDPSKWPGTGTA